MNELEGVAALDLARHAIDTFVKDNKQAAIPKGLPMVMYEKRGVFTTIHTYPEKELRGCIGYPFPVLPLSMAIVRSAVEACHDPRFPPLSKEELKKITVEVSVLTLPEKIKTTRHEDYLKKIRIGTDGLIMTDHYRSGLLLPQVPKEQGWNAEQFLEHLSYKAGMAGDAWKKPGIDILSFQAEIFSEKKPGK